MRRRTSRTLVALLVVAFWLPACETSSGGGGGAPDFGQMKAALLAFDSCDEVEDYLKDVALAEMTSQLEAYRRCLDGGCDYGDAIGAPTRGGWGAEASGGAASLDTGAQASAGSGGEATSSPAPPADPSVSTNGGSISGEEPYSETNTQEEGVDEADIVKNDGQYLYILARGTNRLRIVQAVPVEEMALTSTTEIEGSPLEMFLSGDRVAVFSSLWRYDNSGRGEPGIGGVSSGSGGTGVATPNEAVPDPAPDRGGEEQKADEPSRTPPEEEEGGAGGESDFLAGLAGEILKVTVLDVSDRANPRVIRETYLEAGYVSARMVGSTVHVVGRSYPDIPFFQWYGYHGGSGVDVAPAPASTAGGETTTSFDVDAGSVPPAGNDTGGGSAGSAGSDEPPASKGRYEEKKQPLELWEMDLDEAEAAYRVAIGGLTLDQMMPKRVDVVDGVPREPELLIPCSSFFRPSVSMGLNIVSVFSLDLTDDSGPLNATGILGSSDTVYGSAGLLYIATYVYDYWMWGSYAEADPETALQRTAIHAFDIASLPAQAFYVASGFVDGEVLNQFSMSEYDDYLRVATTERNWFTGGLEEATDNAITVLARDGDELKTVGHLSGLGHAGERIYAARFLGDRGFVVTFRQMDPLVTLDLRDPTNPQKVGELEIPGYSSYLHPLGETHLLTIGRDIRDNGGRQEDMGVKLAIYDVSDLAHPSEQVAPLALGRGSNSEAEYEHKAFTFFAPLGALAIPTGSWWWGGEGETPLNGLSVFTVDTTAGFGSLGTISHADLVPDPAIPEGEEPYYSCGVYLPEVHRSVFIGERVYSISDVGVKVNGVAEGLPEMNAVAFPDPGGYNGYWGGECYRAEPGMPVEVDAGTGGEAPPAEPVDPVPDAG